MKTSLNYAVALVITGIMFSNCSGKKNDNPPTSEEVVSDSSAEPAKASFDINAFPLSTVELGEIPYLTLPAGYEHKWKDQITDLDQLAFWTTDHFEIPEGKVFANRITTVEGKTFSSVELMKELEKSILDAGGVKVHEGKIPLSTVTALKEQMGDNHTLKYLSAYGFMGYAKSWVYVIHQTDKNIWIQFNESDDNASMLWGVLTES